MLHTALVISAYMSMIFIPCACAQWGDVLTSEWRTMRREFRLDMRRRREGMSEVLIRSLREARTAAQIAALAKVAFVEPAPLPRIVFRSRKLHMGRLRPRVLAADPVNFQRAVARVRMRLSQLSEAFRLANTIFDGPMPAMAMAGGPRVSMASIAPPMVNFTPVRYQEPVAPVARPEPAVAKPEPAVAQPEFAQPAIAAKVTQPEVSMQSTSLEARLYQRLFDQVGATPRPAKQRELVAPQVITPQRFSSMPAAIEPSPLLHFPPSAAELTALFALESPATESSDAVPVGVTESSVKISAAA